MKALAKQPLNDRVDYWTGHLIVAIGKGDLRSAVALICMAERKAGYEAGVESVQNNKTDSKTDSTVLKNSKKSSEKD